MAGGQLLAEWCGPCRTEIPELNALAEQLKGQNVGVFGVNFDNVQGAELKEASDKLGIKFTVLAQNPDGSLIFHAAKRCR